MSNIFENLGKILKGTFTVPPEQMLLPNLPHVFTVHHAISGMGDLTAIGEEEVRTAGFMGIWSSTIGFYNFIAALDNMPPQRVLWKALGKKSESLSGSDFGIAFQVTRKVGECDVSFYRLAYFQAKHNKSKNFVILDISQLSGGSNASEKQKIAALQQLKTWVNEKEAHIFQDRKGPEFQIYSLCRADKGFNWTHYVVWDDDNSLTVPSDDVFRFLSQKDVVYTPKDALAASSYAIKLSLNSSLEDGDCLKPALLKDLLLQAITEKHVGWLEVPAKAAAAAEMIADFTQIGASWFIETDSGDSGGLIEALKEKSIDVERVAPSIPAEDYFKQTVNSLQSNQENTSKVTPQNRKNRMG